VQKEVTFFLGLVAPEATLTLDPNEVREARWLSLEAAAEQLDYDATKAMFERVIAYLRTVENLETS
jgi:isopentenyldiphosphate isomerase